MKTLPPISDRASIATLVRAASKALKIEELISWEGGELCSSAVPGRNDVLVPGGKLRIVRKFLSVSAVGQKGHEAILMTRIKAVNRLNAKLTQDGIPLSVEVAQVENVEVVRGDSEGDHDYEVTTSAVFTLLISEA